MAYRRVVRALQIVAGVIATFALALLGADRVAADVDGGGRQCLADIQGNGGKPKYPDRCVVGIKRLVVNGNAGARLNQNPRLDSLVLRVKNTNNDQSLLDGTAMFALAEGDETPSFNLLTTRAADAAERDDAGNFEGLTIAWFTTSGITGLTLPGMMEEPGCIGGRSISFRPQRGPEARSRMSLQILVSFTAVRLSTPESCTKTPVSEVASTRSCASTKSSPVSCERCLVASCG